MGIRHLQTFMFRQCPGGVQEINMKKEIESYKKRFNVDKPVIVIDIISIHDQVYSEEKEKLFGGRFDLYDTRIEEIFKTLISLGVEIICVADGTLFKDKTETIIKRRGEKYNDEWKLLNQIENNCKKLFENGNLRVTNLTPYFYNLKLIAKKHCSVITTNREGDQEIVYQANKHNALAVISNDTDFLIFDGNWQLWSGPDLNIHKCSILRFNRSCLRAHLALSSAQMILFATVAGNDFVKYEMVEPFHNQRCQPNKFRSIANILRKVSSLPPNLTSSDEARLVKMIFKPQDRQQGLIDFRKSISFYCDVKKPIEYSSAFMEKISNSTFLYSILNDIPYVASLYFCDLTKSDLIPYYQLVKPIFQRQMGMILKDSKENLNTITRTIITKLSHVDRYKAVDEIPVFPEGELPNLEEFVLRENNKSDEFYKIKLNIYCWILLPESKILSVETLMSIADEYVLILSIITLLIETNQINVSEADCLLYACVNDFNSKQSVKLNQFTSIDCRDARVAFLFERLVAIIGSCYKILRLPNFKTLFKFDGVYYHYLRQRSNENEPFATLKEKFNSLRIYLK